MGVVSIATVQVYKRISDDNSRTGRGRAASAIARMVHLVSGRQVSSGKKLEGEFDSKMYLGDEVWKSGTSHCTRPSLICHGAPNRN